MQHLLQANQIDAGGDFEEDYEVEEEEDSNDGYPEPYK